MLHCIDPCRSQCLRLLGHAPLTPPHPPTLPSLTCLWISWCGAWLKKCRCKINWPDKMKLYRHESSPYFTQHTHPQHITTTHRLRHARLIGMVSHIAPLHTLLDHPPNRLHIYAAKNHSNAFHTHNDKTGHSHPFGWHAYSACPSALVSSYLFLKSITGNRCTPIR